MSSEVHKYIEKALEKNESLFNAKVISFPNDKSIDENKNTKSKNNSYWKISDKANADQLKAVIGVCFMFGTLILMALYSNLA